MSARITLKNMAFYGYHGCFAGEAAQGQRFFVDVVLHADIGAAAASDALHDTVDYAAVHRVCRELVEGERVKLLETLCARLVRALLEQFPAVERAEVAVRKPAAPIPGVLDYVEVQASADRAGRSHRAGQ